MAEQKKKPKTVRKNVKKKQKEKIDSLLILKVVFALLVVAVIVLSIMVVKVKQEHKNDIKSNIVIPIVNKESEAPFSVNLRALNSGNNEYIFKITNYNSNKINQEDLNYYIDVQNTTDTEITLTRYDSTENLFLNKPETTIEGGKVSKDEKQDLYYVVKIMTPGKLTKDDYVNIKVRAVK